MEHKNVLRFFGIFQHPESRNVFIVSEWMANTSLRNLLESHSASLGDSDLVGMAVGVVEGMLYISQHHIDHGNLSSLNILVTSFHHSLQVGESFEAKVALRYLRTTSCVSDTSERSRRFQIRTHSMESRGNDRSRIHEQVGRVLCGNYSVGDF